MRGCGRRRAGWIAVSLMGLVAFGCLPVPAVFARESTGFRVFPTSLSIILARPPGRAVPSLGVVLIFRSKGSTNQRVYYSVEGDFRAADGRTLPGSAVRIHTLRGETGNQDVLVLDRDETWGVFWPSALPEAWYDGSLWRYSGDYEGRLVASVPDASPADVTVRIRPYQTVEVSPGEFTVVAGSGPGAYESAEVVTVTLRANHGQWELRRSFEPPALEESEPPSTIPLSQLAASEDGGPYERVPETEQVWLAGGLLDEPRRASRAVRLRATVTWNQRAGLYTGLMRLTLEAEPD